jgi:hypothetical protein
VSHFYPLPTHKVLRAHVPQEQKDKIKTAQQAVKVKVGVGCFS